MFFAFPAKKTPPMFRTGSFAPLGRSWDQIGNTPIVSTRSLVEVTAAWRTFSSANKKGGVVKKNKGQNHQGPWLLKLLNYGGLWLVNSWTILISYGLRPTTFFLKGKSLEVPCRSREWVLVKWHASPNEVVINHDKSRAMDWWQFSKKNWNLSPRFGLFHVCSWWLITFKCSRFHQLFWLHQPAS